ncbi:hypothetical protein [Glycomyces terrestris]|uniref:Uncharacterized protein n=1 Tax=Glycomyces terrestris TaxID=2493553 RepID=A0A426UTK5_9ACTN|nr:hypothetical protein [Glycomyces terrestris]RRR97308.1 hypothetical protein EIW28_17995 [Glycomyces terrestris]
MSLQPPLLPAAMPKPASITGVQVLLWVLAALAGIGDLSTVVVLVRYPTAFGVLGLLWGAHATVQALVCGVHVPRGRHWAWVWSLVGAIIGLAFSAAAIVIGAAFIETGWAALAAGLVAAGLHGTLLGLLCSASTRRWILMHRIWRGEVQVAGTAVGAVGTGGFGQAGGIGGAATGSPAAAGFVDTGGIAAGGAAIGGPSAAGFAPAATEGPQRPERRPRAVALAAAAIVLLGALGAWGVFNLLRPIPDLAAHEAAVLGGRPIGGATPPWVHLLGDLTVFACAAVAAPLLFKGRFGGRVLGIVWAALALAVYLTVLAGTAVDHAGGFYDFTVPPGQVHPVAPAYAWPVGRAALALLALVLLLGPGVRAWTPRRQAGPLVVVVQAPGPSGPGQQPAPGQAPPPFGQG